MSYRSGVVTGILFSVVLATAAGGAWWLVAGPTPGAGKPAPPPVPATVAKPLKEDQVNTVVLTAEAEQRLGIKTAAVERKPARQVRVYGGEVLVPPGQTMTVAAPVNGVLRAPNGGALPKPGEAVKAGRPVLQILPLLTPEGRATLSAALVDAEGQVKSLRAKLDAAVVALDRAKQLLKDMAGSQRMVDEAQAAVDVAREDLKAATARHDLFTRAVGEAEKGTALPLALDAPGDGMLRTLAARPGQTVPSGAALFEVVNLDTVWVRVPVYVGDQPDVDAGAPATVGTLSVKPGDPGRPAKPVAAPPSANPAAGTVDLYYELDNRSPHYSPGERVAAAVPLRGEAESLTVPWSAVLHDIQGGTWVYEPVGERTYARRRVAVRFVADDTAVLAAGPAPGTKVVTAGAAELFGAETGFSK